MSLSPAKLRALWPYFSTREIAIAYGVKTHAIEKMVKLQGLPRKSISGAREVAIVARIRNPPAPMYFNQPQEAWHELPQ